MPLPLSPHWRVLGGGGRVNQKKKFGVFCEGVPAASGCLGGGGGGAAINAEQVCQMALPGVRTLETNCVHCLFQATGGKHFV